MILSAHNQFLAGEKAATGNSMCPLGENAAFCQGWNNNNHDYGAQDCGNQNTTVLSSSSMLTYFASSC
jgi:hypothetical protein